MDMAPNIPPTSNPPTFPSLPFPKIRLICTDSESLCGWRGVACCGRVQSMAVPLGGEAYREYLKALEHAKYTSTYPPNLSNPPLGGVQVVGSVWRAVGGRPGMCRNTNKNTNSGVYILIPSLMTRPCPFTQTIPAPKPLVVMHQVDTRGGP